MSDQNDFGQVGIGMVFVGSEHLSMSGRNTFVGSEHFCRVRTLLSVRNTFVGSEHLKCWVRFINWVRTPYTSDRNGFCRVGTLMSGQIYIACQNTLHVGLE